jgi:hypothetical protein
LMLLKLRLLYYQMEKKNKLLEQTTTRTPPLKILAKFWSSFSAKVFLFFFTMLPKEEMFRIVVTI